MTCLDHVYVWSYMRIFGIRNGMTGLFSTIQCPSKARSRLDGSILPVPQFFLSEFKTDQQQTTDFTDFYHSWAIGAGEPEYTQPVMWIFMDFYIVNAKRILQGYPWWIWFSSVQGVFSLSFIDLYVDLDLCVFAAVVTCCHIRWWFGAALCNTPSRLHCRRLGPTVAWLKHDETYELITRENAVSNEDIIQGFLCIRYPRCLGEVCPKCSHFIIFSCPDPHGLATMPGRSLTAAELLLRSHEAYYDVQFHWVLSIAEFVPYSVDPYGLSIYWLILIA